MNDNKTLHSKHTILITSILLTVLLLLGVSYAWLSLTLTGNKENYLKAGTLSLEIIDESSGLNLTGQVPKYDDVGVRGTPYSFKLHNNGNQPSNYTIYLDNVALVANEEQLKDSNIKYQLMKDTTQKNLALLSTLKPSPNRVLDSGKIAAGATISYELRLWIDQDADTTAMNKTFRGQLRIVANQVVE